MGFSLFLIKVDKMRIMIVVSVCHHTIQFRSSREIVALLFLAHLAFPYKSCDYLRLCVSVCAM